MDDQLAEKCVALAIEAGYRLIDTAENYANERGVGRGVRAASVAREEVFITTKFNKRWHGVDLAAEAFQRSAERLGVDYIDLLLIHWPNPAHDRYVQAWEGLIKLRESGRVRAIGTSNFKPAHLQRIVDATGVTPEVNQIQLTPRIARSAARDFHARHGIVTEAWSPLGGFGPSVLDDPLIVRLAETYRRTPAQIILRWNVSLGIVPVARSSNAERIKQNLDLFDFELSHADLVALAALDQGEAQAADSDRLGH
ncbi:MAG: aldo/keto reductase [Chloroflexi bacterium]|nr:aldo/keto reductase [Chloroflexota bacterium]